MKRILTVLITAALLLLLATAPAFAADVFKFEVNKITVFEGDTFTVPLLRSGNPEAEGTLTWKSGSSKILSVDSDGNITALTKGNGKITVTLKTEKKSWTAELSVTVARAVSEVTVDESKLVIYDPMDETVSSLLEEGTDLPVIVVQLGTNQGLSTSALPTDATNRKVNVRSMDEKIIQIVGDNKCTLKPIKAGECDIEVFSVQNPEVTLAYHVLVCQPVSSVEIEADIKTVDIGDTLQLGYSISPANATIQSVIWSSDDSRIATVDETGMVTGIKKGSTRIRATANDGSKHYRTVEITVAQPPEGVSINKSEINIRVKYSVYLNVTVTPNSANNKKVNWYSSDESIATVDNEGKVRGVKAGTCVVTCSCKGAPDVTASCTVNVLQPATAIEFNTRQVDILVNESTDVYWNVSPWDVSDSSVKLTSSNKKIATVDQDGHITGLKAGTATITATAQDGSDVKGTMKVNVIQPVLGVHMKATTYHVGVGESVTGTAVLEPSDATNTNMTWYSSDTDILTVGGTTNRVKMRGQAWGTATITGITEDGGYMATATVKVGDYNNAVRITDLYIQNNKIKIVLKNVSNMEINKIYFRIECFTDNGEPVVCTTDGTTDFTGSYRLVLYPNESTQHGQFTFTDFLQPERLRGVRMYITGYQAEDGTFKYNIPEEKQPMVQYFEDILLGPQTNGGDAVPVPADSDINPDGSVG